MDIEEARRQQRDGEICLSLAVISHEKDEQQHILEYRVYIHYFVPSMFRHLSGTSCSMFNSTQASSRMIAQSSKAGSWMRHNPNHSPDSKFSDSLKHADPSCDEIYRNEDRRASPESSHSVDQSVSTSAFGVRGLRFYSKVGSVVDNWTNTFCMKR